MAYRKKTTRKTARKTSYRKAPAKRRAAPKRKVSTKRKARAKAPERRIVLVIQQAPAQSATLATPAAKAAPVRARFGG